jgi:D-arabinose 1-dehydrogenase-like Zn-dependent alcohol dehydrogenase
VDAALLGQSILPAVREGGRLAAVRPFAGEPDRDVVVDLVRVTDYRYEQEKLAALADAVEQGKLTLRVAETLPPERAAEAHTGLEAGGVRGRLVISF